MFFSQNHQIIPLCSANTPVVTTGVEFDSFNMRGYDNACVIFQFSTTLSASAAILTFECGSADSGDASDLTFHYRTNGSSSGKSASNDVWGDIASASSLTLTDATYRGKCLLVEFNAKDLPAASKTYEWVTASIAAAGASAGEVSAYAILSNYRYAKNAMPTAIA
jgi:hypothetical protein